MSVESNTSLVGVAEDDDWPQLLGEEGLQLLGEEGPQLLGEEGL